MICDIVERAYVLRRFLTWCKNTMEKIAAQPKNESNEEPDRQHITVDKLTCAKTQIDTAIRLYFEDADPISIHTLASAAHEILKDINKWKGGKPLVTELAFLNKPEDAELRKNAINQMRSFQNFFKHADKDADLTKQFRPRLNEYVLAECVEVYRHYDNPTEMMAIFWLWFNALHFEIYPAKVQSGFGTDGVRLFQQIRLKYDRTKKGAYYTKMRRDMEP
jgi:hypothetical protein